MIEQHPAQPLSPEQVSDLEAHVGFWLRRVSNHVSARFARLVEAQGVRVSDWVALRRLFPLGRATPAELVASLGMTKGAISKIVDRLEARGLATRVPHAADRRQLHVALTDPGRALVVTLAQLADENDEHFFGRLPPADRDTLVGLLRALATEHKLNDVPVD